VSSFDAKEKIKFRIVQPKSTVVKSKHGSHDQHFTSFPLESCIFRCHAECLRHPIELFVAGVGYFETALHCDGPLGF
jgi:hypothetical protein